MMKQPTVRPARAAIAAVLAFASTPLLAQVAAPIAPPPIAPTQAAPAPVIAAPTAVAPAAPVAVQATPAPVMAAPSPVVQPTPPPAPVAVEAAPEATVAPRRVSTRSASARTNSVRAEPVTPAVSNRTANAAPAGEATPVAPKAPVETSAVATPTEAAAPATAPVANTATDGNNGLEWGLAGGAAVLIAGLGFMAMRRRRPVAPESQVLEERAPITDYAAAQTIVDRHPVMTEPAYVSPRAAYAAPMAAGTHGSLEAMAAEAPTAANPFLTRKNRLRRAHFLQRQQEGAGLQHAAPVAPAVTQVQEQRRASPVYDFGGGATQRRGFRPATT